VADPVKSVPARARHETFPSGRCFLKHLSLLRLRLPGFMKLDILL
jgi:hypothetical protein